MAATSDRESVELFHLQWLRLLAAGPQKGNYALKGGCNLRFFFGSVRYSEDIDLDVASFVAPATLKHGVDKLLESPVLARLLRVHDLSIASVSKPKQTDTSQKWKVALRSQARAVELHTKIEFSRRPAPKEARLEAVDPQLLRRYGLPPLLAQHYPLVPAIKQKLAALADRRVVQARDVFDLSWLIPRLRAAVAEFKDVKKLIAAAQARTEVLTYDQYVSQVVAYLAPEDATLYDSRAQWESMQVSVLDFLERIA